MQISSFFSFIFKCIYLVCLPTLSQTGTSSSYKSLHAIHIEDYDGKKISQSEIHTFKDVTKIDCCTACSSEKFCVSFHFYPNGPTCVTLRERFEDVTVASTNVPGYQLFKTDKPLATVGSDCELDVDCKPLSNSHCHNGSCTCDVGHRPDGSTCRNNTELCASSPGYTWDVDTDMCYRIETRQTRNWAGAERICTVDQGHLIQPDTAIKNDKLIALLKETPLYAFWIGARFMPGAAKWQWLDNTTILAYQWGHGEPSGDGTCMDLLEVKAYKWNDNNCLAEQNYICEIPLN